MVWVGLVFGMTWFKFAEHCLAASLSDVIVLLLLSLLLLLLIVWSYLLDSD